MQFTCLDRVILMDMFPRFGTLSDQVVTCGLIKKLQLTSDDMNDIGLNKNPDGSLKTPPNWEKGAILTLDLSADEIRIMKDAVDFVDANKRISPEMIDLSLSIKAL